MKKSRQLLRIEDLSAAEIKKLLSAAYQKLKTKKVPSRRSKGQSLGLIFAETSTRTRVSFERAAKSLGFETFLVESVSSSLVKGEDLLDTVLNMRAMGIEDFVVRSASTEEMLGLRELGVGLLNAGDGVGEHPSQALLDLLCLLARVKGSWPALLKTKIAIVGNLSHSRVSNSWISLGKLLKLDLRLVSPAAWKPRISATGWTESLEAGLKGADVVMALRVQKERLESKGGNSATQISQEDYVRRYQITEKLLAGRPLMHPGPINWGVELAADLRTYKNSLILDQVRCGYYLRATLLNEFIASRTNSP